METVPEGPSYSSLLQNRPFSTLWASQLISQSGDAVFDIALLWLVLSATGSTALVGLTQAAVITPAVLVSPLAGVQVDRSNRRNVMIVSNLAQGAITAAVSVLYLLHTLDFSVLILLVLMLYSGAQFFRAAINAIIPSIVTKESLGAANGLFSLSASANQLIGYSLGGIVIALLGPVAPVTYDSLTFFVAAALLVLIAKSYGQARALQSTPAESVEPRNGFWKDFGDGLTYVRRSRLFLELVVLGIVINFFGTAIFALLAPYAKFSVHGNASTYGFLSAAFALGTIVGSVTIGRIDFRHYVGTLLFSGVSAAGVVVGIIGLITSAPIAMVGFLSIGVILAWVNVPINALLQAKIPTELLGRASTVLTSALSGAQPIGAILSGTLAAYFTIGGVFLGCGIAIAASALVLYPLSGELRRAKY